MTVFWIVICHSDMGKDSYRFEYDPLMAMQNAPKLMGLEFKQNGRKGLMGGYYLDVTMRTFHSGGVAGVEDITQGLPRVQELFEARNPKGKATIAEIEGTVSKIKEERGKYDISVTNKAETKVHVTNYGAKLCVEKGDKVKPGDKLTEGAISPKELLAVTDPITTQEYILKEVQNAYRSQGVEISDKHVASTYSVLAVSFSPNRIIDFAAISSPNAS